MNKKELIESLINHELEAKSTALTRGIIERAMRAEENLVKLKSMLSSDEAGLIKYKYSTASGLSSSSNISNPLLLNIFENGKVSSGTVVTSEENYKFFLKGKGLVSYGAPTSTGFIVFKGSQMSLEETNSGALNKSAHSKRKELIEKKLISRKKDHFEFVSDVEFNSPSLAASVIMGNPVSGKKEWKSITSKISLSDFLQKNK